MSPPGVDDDMAAARTALLDALDALRDQLDALVLIGAQAIYLWTGAADLAVAETTDDSDLAIDHRLLADDPLLEVAMTAAGFHRDPETRHPGSWLSPQNVPVDLMLPEAQSQEGGRRGARIPPHSNAAVRRAVGLEAAVVDNEPKLIRPLDPDDEREFEIKVATPAALMVAKLHKLGERHDTNPSRLDDKDAHDLYRLLVAIPTDDLLKSLEKLRRDELSAQVTATAMEYLKVLFAAPESPGAQMAGRAEGLAGNPGVAAASAATLASDLIQWNAGRG